MTKCDGIMIGRGALGNPFIFKEISSFFKNGKNDFHITNKMKLETCKKHLNYLLEFKSEKVAILQMRTHAAWYLKGMKGSSDIKKEIFKADSKDKLIKILEDYEKNVIIDEV